MPTARANLPNHVAIIMDGNGRWAKQRHLPRIAGHRRGAAAVRAAVAAARDLGIRYLTLYAFSAENWQRPPEEVSALMGLLDRFLQAETRTLVKNRIRLHAIGRVDELPPGPRRQLQRAIEATAAFSDWHLILALNYGSRTEVADAARAYAAAAAAGRERLEDCSWTAFRRYLYTADIPDPDLLIRTSGESRLSNFLLLQCAYAEMIFSPVLWPDFSKAEFAAAIEEYQRRERRFGRTAEQLEPGAPPPAPPRSGAAAIGAAAAP